MWRPETTKKTGRIRKALRVGKKINKMKLIKLNFIVILITIFTLSSCTIRLVDFTVISTKNAEIGVDRSKGLPTDGKKSYFFGIGWNLKDALDNALEKAGPEYDLLIDGVVFYKKLPLRTVIKVKGLAVKSSDLRAFLGQKGYEDWCKANDIFDPNTAKMVSN